MAFHVPQVPMVRRTLFATSLLLALAACGGSRETQPARTATEQLLFSVAAERAADRLALNIPAGTKVFVDPAYVEGTDSKYLLSTIRDRVLRHGGSLADNKAQADLVIEPRIGAISIDRDRTTLGMEEFDVPVPMAGEVHVPSIALYKRDTQQGVIKIAATSYDSKTGKLIQSLDPVYGFSHKTEWGAFLIFSWETNDLMPDGPDGEWVGD
jgi:hypothetical protein